MTIRLDELRLHDATLVSIFVDWGAGTANILFRIAGGLESVVSASGVSSLVVPREQPWGPSVSVNAALVSVTADGRTRLTIEMQSGDEIVVDASVLEISRTS